MNNYRWLWVSLIVFVLDQITKFIAVATLMMRDIDILPVFRLRLAYNTGAAFSFLNDAGGWQNIFFVFTALIISAVILLWIRKLERHELQSVIGLFLIVGGALGNAIDRVRIGKVVDFLMAHYQEHAFPIFNIADSAITIGAALLILDSFGVRLFGQAGGNDRD